MSGLIKKMLTQEDLGQIDKIVKKRVQGSEEKIISKINLVIGAFEKADSAIEYRVERIEKHLNLS